MTSRVVFRDAKGRELAEADLADATGRFKWEVVGGENVPEKAQELHREGQALKEDWQGTSGQMPPRLFRVTTEGAAMIDILCEEFEWEIERPS
jgi:hypothetical protein